MKYDLLIRDGEVVDPVAGLRGLMDVGIAGGKIVEVAAGLPEEDARRTISAKNRLVTPGLVDVHAHVFVLRDGAFEFRDTDGNTVTGKRRLINHLTLKDGRICYERAVE